MEFDIAQNEHKELREEIFAQVACHISVTFTSQNNSRLPLALTSASSLCLSHALCVDSEGNLLKNSRQSFVGWKCVWVGLCWGKGGGREQYFLCLDGLFIWKWQKLTEYLSGTLDLAQGGGTSTFYTLSCFCGVTRDNEAVCTVRRNVRPLFHPVHSQITIAGINFFFLQYITKTLKGNIISDYLRKEIWI